MPTHNDKSCTANRKANMASFEHSILLLILSSNHTGKPEMPIVSQQIVKRKERKRKCRDFTCNSKADKMSLVYQKIKQRKMKGAKQNKNRGAISPEMVIKIHESTRSILKGEGNTGKTTTDLLLNNIPE